MEDDDSRATSAEPAAVTKFVPIRPRPAPQPPKLLKRPKLIKTKSQKFIPISSHVPGKCPVPICIRKNCQLSSHKNYGKQILVSQRSSSSGTPSPLLQIGLSGLPDLPLEADSPAIYRTLFYEFFSLHYDRVAVIVAPAPTSLEQQRKLAVHKNDMLHRGLTTPVYCLNYVASGFIARPQLTQDTQAVVLYSRVTKLLREKLASFTADEVDNLIVVLLSLLILDLVLQNYNHLEIHRAGMALLVNSKGGLHNLAFSLPYALNLDRMIAIHSFRPPVYIQRIDRALQKPAQFDHVYGGFFDSPKALAAHVPPSIIEYCQDVVTAVELFEGQKINFRPISEHPASEDTHYFYFLRNRVTTEFAFLNAEHRESTGKARCMLMAAKIVEYWVLTDNYISTISSFFAVKIRACLEHQDIKQEWKGLDAALRWVLWTMACTFSQGDDAHTEIMKFLVDQAELMYDRGPFPLDWNEQGLATDCVRNFVWSKHLDDRLQKVCDQEAVMLRTRLKNRGRATQRSTPG